jgi:hypothetical protein
MSIGFQMGVDRMTAQLQDTELYLLDCFLNIGDGQSIQAAKEQSIQTVHLVRGSPMGQLEEQWDSLEARGLFREEDYSASIATEHEEPVKAAAFEYLSRSSIAAEVIGTQLDQRLDADFQFLNRLTQVLGISHERRGRHYVSFFNYDWSGEEGRTCDDLVQMGLMFRAAFSSRKNTYRTYTFRCWPFDAADMLHKIILKHLGVERLSPEQWQLLDILLLAGDSPVSLNQLVHNSGFTIAQVRDWTARFEEQGLITRQGDRFQISRGLRQPLTVYWAANVYPQYSSKLLNRFQMAVRQSLGNLYPYLVAKRIYESAEARPDNTSALLKRISRAEASCTDEQLIDMCNLDLVINYENSIAVSGDFLQQIGDWLLDSISTEAIFIPARSSAYAHDVFRDIFARCEEYVKIQDPYIDVWTIELLGSLPDSIDIQFLTNSHTVEDEERQPLFEHIQRLRRRRNSQVFVRFIGNGRGGSPLHDRIIISKSACWQVSTSLKDIGHGRDAAITPIGIEQKRDHFEPAFERWWDMEETELQRKGFRRFDLAQWFREPGQ